MSNSLDPNGSALFFGTTLLAFLALFTTVILLVPRQATLTRYTSLIALSTLTYVLQETLLQLCKNPHWRAAAAPLLWIQFLSASEWILVSRLDAAHIPRRHGKHRLETIATQATDTIALLWNLRRVNTKWQAKNVPTSSSSGPASSSRARFILRRLTTTLLAYLVMDIIVSAPPLGSILVSPEKATLLKLRDLSSEDLIFRTIGTLSFWLSTALINLIMSNSIAIISVLTGLSAPANCPPLYGSIGDAYTIRRFWGYVSPPSLPTSNEPSATHAPQQRANIANQNLMAPMPPPRNNRPRSPHHRLHPPPPTPHTPIALHAPPDRVPDLRTNTPHL